MSAALLGLAFKAKLGDSKTRKLVLLKLVDCCDDEGENIYPALATVAEEAVCSTQQVRRVLRDFCAVGLLRKVKDGGKGAGSTAHYAMDIDLLGKLRRPEFWPALEAAALVKPADGGDDDEDSHASDAGRAAAAPPAADGSKGYMVSPLHGGRVTSEGNKGDSWSHPTPYIEPLEDSEREGVRAQACMPASDGQADPDHAPDAPSATLDDFRKRWPDIHLSSQRKVEAAWTALPFAMRREAVDGIAGFLADNSRKGRSYSISAGTYLEERRWALMPVQAEGKGAVPAGGYDVFKAWSRDWWFHLLDRIHRGELVKHMAMRADSEPQSAWSVPVAVMAAARARIGELQPFLCIGPEIAAWRPWFAQHGARIPVFEGSFRVFLPGPMPPGGPADDGDEEVKF